MDLQRRVEKALEQVRPAIISDGGNIELVKIEENKVYVKLTGACQGCPSSSVTLKRGVMVAIKREAPEIEELVEVLANGSHRTQQPTKEDPWAGQKRIDGVKLIIAVASGKGGVGKSTVAVNLVLALKHRGLSVGLLDADIYGPSAPTMLNVHKAPPPQGEVLMPAVAYGMKVISIGMFVPHDAPMIWRGPMIMKAINQFLHDVDWGELDCLVVDLPPGTGDAQLSLAQQVPVDGVVIVTTPSDVALVDVRRGIQMFNKINVPVIGIIENMSYFKCPHCDERTDIFASGGGKKTAEDFGANFLGEIPLDPQIRRTGDEGKPIVEATPDSPQGKEFIELAGVVWERITTIVPSWDKNACHVFEPQKKFVPLNMNVRS